MLLPQLSQVRSTERANAVNELIVEASVLESFTLESIDEVSIAGRQTSEGSENNLCDQGICRLGRSDGRGKRSVCLFDAIRQLANCRHELVIVMIRTEIRLPEGCEAWLRDEICDPAMHRVGMPEQEAGPAVHSPTG